MSALNTFSAISPMRTTRPLAKTLTMVAVLAISAITTAVATAQKPTAPSKTVAHAITGPTAPREQTADQQVQQVLSRLAFGARPGDVQAVRDMGVDVWIARQLEPKKIPDASMDEFLKHFTSLDAKGGELEAKYPPPGQALAKLAAKEGISRDSARLASKGKNKKNAKDDDAMMAGSSPAGSRISAADSLKIRQAGQESYRVVGELSSAKIARAVGSERQLNEVMVDFWENHFNLFAGKDRTRYYLPEFDKDVIRPNALGKFRTLLGAVAKSPAMLTYLDNAQSVADSGRPTLRSAQLPRRIAVNSNAIRMQGRGARAQQMTIGELMDRKLLAPQQEARFSKLSPENLAELRSLTLAQAMQRQDLLAPKLAARRPKGVNENYARELMELHTLGVDGGYTQADVIQVARALTGWTIAPVNQGGDFLFRPETHDAGAKMILGVQFPAGRGIEDGEEVLDMLAKSPATAKFIATKLARRFVSDVPPQALIDRAARTFLSTDGDIRETLRTIITSPEFFSAASYRSKVKSPFELVTSTLRAMGAQPDSTPRAVQFVARLGEPMFGHQAPDGYPEDGDAWMNTGSILNRINFGLAAASGRVPNVSLSDWAPGKELASLPREQQVDGVIRALFGGAASADTRDVLLTGTNPFLQGKASTDSLSVGNDNNDMNAMAAGAATGVQGVSARKQAALDARKLDQQQRVPVARQQAQAARDAAKPGQGASLTQAIGNLPPLTGFAQIVGLALGAPEFQRR